MEYENNQNDISSNHCIPNKREQGKGGGGWKHPKIQLRRHAVFYIIRRLEKLGSRMIGWNVWDDAYNIRRAI